jgi:hypothetical protein
MGKGAINLIYFPVATFFKSPHPSGALLAEMPLSACGSRKLQIHPLGDHLSTFFFFTTYSGVKKTHDWVVDQIPDLFHTTHKVKTQQVVGDGVSDVGTSN